MFNKNSKIRVWALIIALAFMAVIPGKAVGDFNPAVEEQRAIQCLRDYTDVSFEVRWEINEILNRIETERRYWLICLPEIASTEAYFPERNHPELYYLWLAEKFDKILNFLQEDYIRSSLIKRFINDLLDLVFSIDSEVCFYHEVEGWSAVKIRQSLVGTPSYYDFEKD